MCGLFCGNATEEAYFFVLKRLQCTIGEQGVFRIIKSQGWGPLHPFPACHNPPPFQLSKNSVWKLRSPLLICFVCPRIVYI